MKKLIYALAFLLLSSCVTSPTGRKQLILVSEQQMNQMGTQAFQDMKQKIPIEKDPQIKGYVQCVANAILQAAGAEVKKQSWELVVFQDKSANAFALPSGKIGVHTGLLAVAKNQHQLATVIGHEIGHVLARHGNERVSQSILAQSGIDIAGNILAEQRGKNIVLGALGLGAQFGFLYPHSRKQEAEADNMGLMLMAKAGFDPAESIELWQNMHKASSSQPPEFLSTHPSHASRISQLSQLQATAKKYADKAKRLGRTPACKV